MTNSWPAEPNHDKELNKVENIGYHSPGDNSYALSSLLKVAKTPVFPLINSLWILSLTVSKFPIYCPFQSRIQKRKKKKY